MTDPVPPNLHACLTASSWRHLLALMASHGLPCSTRWHKADLIPALLAHLQNAATWRQRIPELGEPAQAALRSLLHAQGAVSAIAFQASFGDLRPYRPWRRETTTPPPWQAPASPAERLWYLGLIFLDPPAPAPGVAQRVVIPADLLPILRDLLAAADERQPRRLLPRPGTPADLAWHVALLLATVEARPLAPIRGRWLPPRSVAALAVRTGLASAADGRIGRSEHSLPYLAFLHLLAEAAGLIAGGERLTVTAAGWQWLAAAPADRWQTLWDAWLAAPTELARAYRFPWTTIAPAGRRLVLEQVRATPLAAFRPLAEIVQAAHLHDPLGYLAPRWGYEGDVAADLVTGPLFWFGVVDLAEAADSAAPSPAVPTHHADPRLDEDLPADRPVPVSPYHLLRLTRTGAWLLGLPDCAAPAFPAAAACSSAANDPDLLLVPPTAAPIHLARLAPLAEWETPSPPAMTQPLRLTPEAIGRAAAAGLPLPQLLDHLAQALGRPVSRRQTQRLRDWAAAGQQVRIRHLTVLETADPELMGRLRGRKLIRRHLGDPLSPTRSILDPAGIPALAQHLATLGLYARLDPAGLPAATAADDAAALPPDAPVDDDDLSHPESAGTAEAVTAKVLDAGDAAAGRDLCLLDPGTAGRLYSAALVYRGLGEHIALPAPILPTMVDALARQLDPRQRQAAEYAADQALKALDAVLQGYLDFPAWQADRSSAETLPLIERAIAQHHDLRLTYWGAGRAEPVVRRVTPYWIERRHAVPYLVGYCHLREAERVFRIDRIADCQLLPRTEVGD